MEEENTPANVVNVEQSMESMDCTNCTLFFPFDV